MWQTIAVGSLGASIDQPLHGANTFLPGRETVDNRAQLPGHAATAFLCRHLPCRGPVKSAAPTDKCDALVPKGDEMLQRRSHAEREIGAHIVTLSFLEPTQHLHHGRVLQKQTFHDVRLGALGRSNKEAVHAVLAHALDESILLDCRLCRIG